jgi:hypothetical protein
MANPQLGGRGVRAPYTTTHCRIPEPLKATIEQFAAAYRILVNSDDKIGCENLIKSVQDTIASLGESEQKINELEAKLAASKSEVGVLKNERELTIKNLLTAFGLGSREGVKMKAAIAIALPEVQERYESLVSDRRGSKK